MSGPLVSCSWLRQRLGDSGLRVVDCRFRLGEPGAGEELWGEGHIPGAAFLDVDSDLAAEPGERGRHPLPEPEAFEEAARRAGIVADTLVIAYDEAAEGGAARLWWLLRHFGHDRVAVLDGGLRAWRDEGVPLETGAEQAAADAEQRAAGAEPGGAIAPFLARPRGGDTRELDELAAMAAAEPTRPGAEPARPGAEPARVGAEPARPGAEPARPQAGRLLLDARAPERFRGEVEPIDAVAGHIPGAANLPFGDVAPGGRFLEPDELRARFEAAGAAPGRELVAYCGSGVSACVLLLAAEVAGLEPGRLYPGSWSEWSGRGLPVERH